MAVAPKQTTFNTIASNAGMNVHEEWEQWIEAGAQFDGTVGKGLINWIDTGTGRTLQRVKLVCGAEAKNTNLEVVDANGLRWSLDKRIALVATSLILTFDFIMGPKEWLEFTTVGATAAMRLDVILKR